MEYKKYKRICVLDTETTSVYWNSAAPVQIAALILDEHGKILDEFNERIRTTHTIDPEASKIHGIYARDLKGCRPESEVLTDFCVWMKSWEVDAVLTYNGEAFDRPMLNCRIGYFKIPVDYFDVTKFPGIDAKTDVMAAKKKKLFGLDELGRKWKLTLVAEKLGFSTEDAHDASADIRMLKDVWLTLDKKINPQDWNHESGDVVQLSLF